MIEVIKKEPKNTGRKENKIKLRTSGGGKEESIEARKEGKGERSSVQQEIKVRRK